ncbi:hypothetical protein V494_06571 [Pseudogymnoascus sp. VKM F-4513 (FW-928)]|nr:hypothetical protein V494_06571 [Pseudogymnoascus sp. VKM F-4513 (FW-928)]
MQNIAGEPGRIGEQENDLSQIENATDKRREQGCVTVVDKVKRLEAGQKVETGQPQSDFTIAVQEDYDMVQVLETN